MALANASDVRERQLSASSHRALDVRHWGESGTAGIGRKSGLAAVGPVEDIRFTLHHLAINATNYFLPPATDETDLSPWSSILPSPIHGFRTNLFGDSFLVDASGAVHILDRGGCSTERIAASEEEFWRAIKGDSEGWQLRPLADECRDAGKLLAEANATHSPRPPCWGENMRSRMSGLHRGGSGSRLPRTCFDKPIQYPMVQPFP